MIKPRTTSADGLAIIKHFEGLRLDAYLCPANVWTIGYGHTGGVKKGDKINLDTAITYLQNDLRKFERIVTDLVKVPIRQNHFDALVSFSYNVGGGALADSTLLKRLNAGYFEEAAEQFKRWNKGGGKVLQGLVKRRNAERLLFSNNPAWRDYIQ